MEDKNKYFKDNYFKSIYITERIFQVTPELGIYVEVNGLKIPAELFEDEFKTIKESYYKVLDKIKDYNIKNQNDRSNKA